MTPNEENLLHYPFPVEFGESFPEHSAMTVCFRRSLDSGERQAFEDLVTRWGETLPRDLHVEEEDEWDAQGEGVEIHVHAVGPRDEVVRMVIPLLDDMAGSPFPVKRVAFGAPELAELRGLHPRRPD